MPTKITNSPGLYCTRAVRSGEMASSLGFVVMNGGRVFLRRIEESRRYGHTYPLYVLLAPRRERREVAIKMCFERIYIDLLMLREGAQDLRPVSVDC